MCQAENQLKRRVQQHGHIVDQSLHDGDDSVHGSRNQLRKRLTDALHQSRNQLYGCADQQGQIVYERTHNGHDRFDRRRNELRQKG